MSRPAAIQGWRDLTRLQADFVAQIGAITHRVITVLDRTFPDCAPCFGNVFGQTARTV